MKTMIKEMNPTKILAIAKEKTGNWRHDGRERGTIGFTLYLL